MKVSLHEAIDLVEIAVSAKLVCFIWGSPGVGKSSIVHQIANKHKLKMIDIRLSQCDPVDLSGFPFIIDGKASYIPMDVFPVEETQIPDGYNGWMCHHKDTEVLTKDFGFIKFENLVKGTEVAQYNMQTKEITYAIPEAYISYHKKGNIVVNDNNVKYAITEDHDLIIQSKPTKYLQEWKTYKRKPLEVTISGDLVFPVAGYIKEGRDYLTEEEKLAIAYQADGSIKWEHEDGNTCTISFGFTKQRKIDQFKKDFPTAKEAVYASRPEMHYFTLKVSKDFLSKDFKNIFKPSQFSATGCKAFLDYVVLWDGFQAGKGYGYGNTNKNSVDIVQEFAILSGHKTSISTMEDNRSETFSTYYKVHWYDKPYYTTQALKDQQLVPYDDKVYCLKIPQGTLITRYKNQVLISGNCFLDEMNAAPRSVQASSYKLVLDRMVGQHRLHDRVAIVCAGNLDTDNAITEEMSTALQSRLCHIEVFADLQEFLKYAMENNFDYRITSYLEFKPTSLYSFKPDHSDKTYASPRTWEFCNEILKKTNDYKKLLPLLSGVLSEGIAREFIAFMKHEDKLAKISDIVANPTGIKIPEEPSILYALTGALSHHINEETCKELALFIDRLPTEFQIITFRGIALKHKTKWAEKLRQDWVNKNFDMIM